MGLPARTIRNRFPLGIALIVWTVLVTAGLAGITRYAMTPGAPARSRGDWPSGVSFDPSERDLTVVISLHAKCPCSRATVSELAKLIAKFPQRLSVIVLRVGSDDGVLSLDAIQHLPQVSIISDESGTITDQFGAKTSGQLFAFDRAGHLKFSGGITASRGHEGDNAGSDAIAAILESSNNTSSVQSASVFGCPLTDSRSEP